MRRVSVSVPDERLEPVRALMLELHPEGFEEAPGELAVYTDSSGEARLREAFGDVAVAPVEPGWEERWREFHQPLWVGPVWIGPSWERPPDDAIAVVVDPGRAFGTGSHPTTRLCLELLLELERGSLLDVGCGSGILAVAGAKLGFAPVVAVDRDPAATAAASRNALANQVAVDVRQADARTGDLPRADVTVANLDLATVEAVGSRLEGGVLVTAGYFHSRTPRLEEFRHRERRIDGGWAADVFERQ